MKITRDQNVSTNYKIQLKNRPNKKKNREIQHMEQGLKKGKTMNIKSKEKCQQMYHSKVEGCESIQPYIDVLGEILLGRR
jgi:hypothetical protein